MVLASCGTLDQGTVYRRRLDDNLGWEAVLSEPGMGRISLAIAPSSQNVIYALSASNLQGPGGHYEQGLHALYRSSSHGDPGSWQVQVDIEDPIKLHTLLLTNPLAASYLDCGVYYENRWVSSLAVHPTSSDVVAVGTSEGLIHINHDSVGSNDTTVWPSVRPRDGFVSWLAFDPGNPETLYATYAGFGGDHVWRSTDGGETWSSLAGTGAGTLPDIPVHSIVVDPGDGRRLYIGTDLGVFTSVNGGATWAVENTGFANAVTEALTLAEDADGRSWLFAFTHGRGAWRVRLQALSPPPRHGGRRLTP